MIKVTAGRDLTVAGWTYIEDFGLCFQSRADSLRTQETLAKRLGRSSLTLEPTKTKLVEFGLFAHRHASKNGRRRQDLLSKIHAVLRLQSD